MNLRVLAMNHSDTVGGAARAAARAAPPTVSE